MQTLGIETDPFKETDRGESVPVVLHVDQTLPENTRAASWQFQSCTERVHQAPCSKRRNGNPVPRTELGHLGPCPPFQPLAGPPPSEDHPWGILYLEGLSQPLGQVPPTQASDSVVCIPSSSDSPGGLSQGSDSSLGSQGDAEAADPHLL